MKKPLTMRTQGIGTKGVRGAEHGHAEEDVEREEGPRATREKMERT